MSDSPEPEEDVDLLVDDVLGEDAEAVLVLDGSGRAELAERALGHLEARKSGDNIVSSASRGEEGCYINVALDAPLVWCVLVTELNFFKPQEVLIEFISVIALNETFCFSSNPFSNSMQSLPSRYKSQSPACLDSY